jgi:hypothetical protein
MKVVIQCSATKNAAAGSFTQNGQRVKFVAHPELYGGPVGEVPFKPDAIIPSEQITWRDHLLAYNQIDDNPDHLLPVVELYSNKVYRNLLNFIGEENLYILSAGWGLIRANFKLPDYDITFSQSEPWKRRTKHDEFLDFAQLTQSELPVDEQIYFFGSKDYLPLYYRLTQNLVARKVVYFKSSKIKKHAGYEYILYGREIKTNWHYSCAKDFMAGRIAM